MIADIDAADATRSYPTREIVARLARAAVGGLITVAQAADSLSIPRRVAASRLQRLTEQGWLARAQRGVYLVKPLEALGSGAPVAEDPWVVARQLFSPCYIGGWSAAEHWELTEQLFRSTFVVSAAPGRRRRHEVLLAAEFRIVRVEPARVESVSETWRGPVRVRVSSRARTIADALVRPDWLGGVRHLAEILRAYREMPEFRPLEVLAELEALGSGAGIKRLGYLAERVWPAAPELVARAHEQRSKGVIRLDPAVPSAGRIDSRWGLSINVDLDDRGSA